jgi:23S rRNA G2445 N2-methylase RlmL
MPSIGARSKPFCRSSSSPLGGERQTKFCGTRGASRAPVEAAQAAARVHPDWRRRYVHLAMRQHKQDCPVPLEGNIAQSLHAADKAQAVYGVTLRAQVLEPRVRDSANARSEL